MKVAVLIRGEPRHFKEGHSLLKHLLFNRFPDIDFRIFSAISPTLTETKSIKTNYTSNDDYSSFHPVYSTVKLSEEKLKDIVETYAPGRFTIINNHKIINSMEIIMENYFEKMLSENSAISKLHNSVAKIDTLCRWFYFFSQHINYLESRQCLINYSVENNWIPDMVITTRIDLFFKFDYDFFDNWRRIIEETRERFSEDGLITSRTSGFVFPKYMTITDNNVWIDDWLFIEFYNSKMYDYYNKSVTDIFLDYLSYNKNWTKNMYSGHNSHFLWSFIYSDMLMCAYPASSELNYFAGILRPCSNFDLVNKILETDMYHDEQINHILYDLSESQRVWKNGKKSELPPIDVVMDTFKLLCTT